MNINYNTSESTSSSSVRSTKKSAAAEAAAQPTEYESQSITSKALQEESRTGDNLMACIANVTCVNVPTSGPEVSSSIIMTRDHHNMMESSQHGCGGNSSVKGTNLSSHHPPPTILKIPSVKDIAVAAAARGTSSTNHSNNKNQNAATSFGSGILSAVSNKSSVKKRGRSEQMPPSDDSCQISSSKKTRIDDSLDASSNNNRSTTTIQEEHNMMDKTEIALTQEQIDDVIDTTLPSNFSFRLPLSLSPNHRHKTMTESPQEYKSLPKNNTGRPKDAPPLTTVVVFPPKMIHPPVKPRDGVGDHDQDDEEATATPSQSSMGGHDVKTPTSGRWTKEEHEAFLEGLEIYGREWKKVAQRIPTRTSAQIRSHAQKYFAKLSRDEQSRTTCLVNVQERDKVLVQDDRRGEGGEAAQDNNNNKVVEYPPSVLDRMEKILRDPLGAEMEVAQTLKRLRERYSELHARLQHQHQEINQGSMIQKQRHSPPRNSPTVQGQHGQMNRRSPQSGKVFSPIYTTYPGTPKCDTTFTSPMQTSTTGLTQKGRDLMPKKQTSGSFTPVPQTPTTMTNASKQSKPSIRICNESLALHSKELIALSVLGGELYRSASYQDLSKAVAESCSTSSTSCLAPSMHQVPTKKDESAAQSGTGCHFSHPTTRDPPPVLPSSSSFSLSGKKSFDTDSKE
jgi:Myb-like DNA-binding domain.